MPTPRSGYRKRRPISEALEAAAVRSEKTERLVSLSRFSELTGFDRGTIRGWIDKKCPIEPGSGGKGEAIIVDIRAVWQWREETVRAEERAKFASHDDVEDTTPLTPSDRLKLEQIKLAQIKIGQQAEILVPRDLAEYATERMFGQIRQAVMAVPDRLFRLMSGIHHADKADWYRQAQGQCRAALAEGAKAVALALPDVEDRMRAGIPAMDSLPGLPGDLA